MGPSRGGGAAGLAALFALIFTNASLRATDAQLQVNEQGQITDRYTRAIDQLGSTDPDVRLGGIYALERLSHDSPRDQPTIMDVLIDFVREHAQDLPPSTYKPVVAAPTPLSIDVHAALTVIGRRNRAYDDGFTFNLAGDDFHGRDLSALDLTRANLSDANLAGAFLVDADLTRANLSYANLAGAFLVGADLTRAELTGATLTHAELFRATLSGATLFQANLSRADLVGADLTRASMTFTTLSGATLFEANLTGADLSYATLTRANLSYANLTGADLSYANLTGAHLTGVRGQTKTQITSQAHTDKTTSF